MRKYMRRIFSKKDRAIREAFQIYDSARIRSVGGDGTDFRGNPSGENSLREGEEYLHGFQESRVEERIYRMIEKLPIRNPRKKARRIWVGGVAAVLLCVLAGCMAHYVKEKPVRVTRALQEVYRASGERMGSGKGNPLTTSEGLLYQCHYLTEEEQETLQKSGVAFQRVKNSVYGDFSQEVRVYHISGRESRQFILVKDRNNLVALGKFIAYNYCGGVLAAAQGAGGKEPECSTADVLEKVMGIHSAEDIRTVTLERSRETSKEDPQRMVAMWTGEEDRTWFYDFFSEENRICAPYPAGRETKEEVEQIKSEGMPITYGKGICRWQKHVLERMPDQAFYLEIENRYREIFVLGLVLEDNRAEVWLEPLEEWVNQNLQSGAAAATYSDWVNPELAQAGDRNGIICLSQKNQMRLSGVMRKVLEK